jgi:hypothetical protein
LLYVGQTGDARRRLRDLPVGESHHLATTVPPEIWERVVVVQWPSLLNRISRDEAQVAERLQPSTCGLAMEYLLQVCYRPLLNSRRRSNDGVWTARNIESSRSKGAIARSELPELFGEVRGQWEALTGTSAHEGTDAVVYAEAGRVVFPGLL